MSKKVDEELKEIDEIVEGIMKLSQLITNMFLKYEIDKERYMKLISDIQDINSFLYDTIQLIKMQLIADDIN